MNRLVFGGIRHVAQLNAAQVLDPAHALHTGHYQAQWVAVFWPQHFTVLAVGYQHFAAVDQAHGDGARHARSVGSFGQYEFAAFVVRTAHV